MALDTALLTLLSPLLLAQSAWVLRRAMRLPEPKGPRAGCAGKGTEASLNAGPTLRFLQIGDSSAIGVGVDRQEQALAPQLAARLAARPGQNAGVDWTLLGANGATTADAPDLLAPVRGQHFEMAYVIFGVNDVKNLRPATAWQRDYTALLDRLRDAHGVQVTFVSGLPPIHAFPLIPDPLRAVLAMRARRFDRLLQEVVARRSECIHIPLPAELDPSGMAPDGFHPGAAIYTEWAEGAAEIIGPHIPRSDQSAR